MGLIISPSEPLESHIIRPKVSRLHDPKRGMAYVAYKRTY